VSVAISPQAGANIGEAIVLAAPIAFVYAWYRYFKQFRNEPPRWRTHVTLAALILMTLGGALLVPYTLIPRPPGTVQPVGAAATIVVVAMRIELVAFVACFFGRARTIFPIAYACFGAVLFWTFITMG